MIPSVRGVFFGETWMAVYPIAFLSAAAEIGGLFLIARMLPTRMPPVHVEHEQA